MSPEKNCLAQITCTKEPIQLPLELEREVFEIAAQSGSLQCTAELCLVARRVREWVEPFLYEMLIFSSYDAFPSIYQDDDPDLRKLPAYSTATSHAQHVFLEGLDSRVVMEILLHCTQVTNVSIWACRGVNAYTIGTILKSRPIERLSMNFEDLFPLDCSFNPAFFPHLTHLELVDMDPIWERCKKLILLPKLTHLSLTFPPLMFAQQALENCRNLRILILKHLGTNNPFQVLAANIRVVSTRLLWTTRENIENWKEGAQGGRDFWQEAEEVVASRSREIVGSEADN
ncbi:hypothetical protein CVT26_002972 [Gymnopilus dilepis]|uniref:F-box domain-containing protein n=1 Tax=Gymnopilus dilepis TaxID=231916 RepID=A0A409Y4I1_9AGAR|nr:hypothetical protein CVT26_002972 [Gymnopilus dilepis]